MTREQLDKIDKNSVVIIDIREENELLSLPAFSGATHIPMKKLLTEANHCNLPKDKLIVTVCRSGSRCKVVNRILSQMGYRTDLLEGGMNAYQQGRG